MSYIYTTEPHPTCNGKLLAIAPKPESWRCLSDTEHAFVSIGGKHWREHQKAGSVAYTLSPSQARDLDAILRAGLRPYTRFVPEYREADDPAFWNPETGDDLTKSEALALIAQPKRCTRTAEMDFSAPLPTEEIARPTAELAEIYPRKAATGNSRRHPTRRAKTIAANATALLRAARRSDGAYIWGPSLCLTVPRRHHLGWLAFTWHDGERQCTVDLSRHRTVAKAEARRIIAAKAEVTLAA